MRNNVNVLGMNVCGYCKPAVIFWLFRAGLRISYNKSMSRPLVETARKTMLFSEIVSIAIDSFRMSKVRFFLTALGMVIGTASLIVVVTIGLTGKQYIMNVIQSIGANLIYAYYESGSTVASTTGVSNDYLTVDDMRAVRQQVSEIQAASPMVELRERIAVGSGKERETQILAVDPEYAQVRNLQVLAGRFFDSEDSMSHAKVAVVTQSFAKKVYGSEEAAKGVGVKIQHVQFTIVGVFRESIDTFGQSEIAGDTILIPYTTGHDLAGAEPVKQLFFSVSDSGDVPRATALIEKVIQSRHRAESVYRVDNLTQWLAAGARIANALIAMLLAISLLILIVSGIGIMNIMLASVRTRIREIGIRKAIGATNREIKLQFLTEAILISLSGGLIGIVLGLAAPVAVRLFTEYHIPISGLSVLISIFVASLVGIIFGTVPATRAAQLDPVDALHYE
jgi:putative ABC transport system permease protein